METRLLRAALLRRRGMAALAALAVAIGASVASALLHVSGDVSRKLAHELRSLGPNLLIVPAGADADAGPSGFLDHDPAAARLAAAGIDAVPLLYVVARIDGEAVQIVGTDLDRARRLHPGWRVPPGRHATLMGARLARRLDVETEAPVVLTSPDGARTLRRAAGPVLRAIPLADAQALAGLEGRVSLFQARIEGGAAAAAHLRAAIEEGGMLRAVPIAALTAVEAGLLARMRRLMALVTVAALLAAGLAAFGTLTDLALERRREIALMKALGAGPRDVVRQFAVESLAIGLVGGVTGWLLGLAMAEVIGREVFHSSIGMLWHVPPIVLVLSLAVAAVSSLGPIRLALAVEPARALKGD
jgi:putative ABC transport system permease protein